MGTHSFQWRRFWHVSAIVLIAIGLANCATTGKPVRRAQYHPAPTSYYTAPVERGDTVASLAARYRVKQDDVVVINELPDRTARVSGTVRIPAYGRSLEGRKDSGPKGRGSARRGGKGKAVAARGNGKGKVVARKGRGKDTIEVRQLPPAGGKGGKGKAGPYIAKNGASGKGKGEQKSGKPGAQGGPNKTAGKVPPRQAPQQSASASVNKRFLWPVNGQVISSFGRSADGARNDGINISAREGAPVRAADAGTVTYVGNELKGYGNLVLIRHDSGYVTAYAHSERVAVARGERVERGQIIAYAGATGDVNQPQLHFELRFNTKPVDPVPYLVASASPASSPARRPGPV